MRLLIDIVHPAQLLFFRPWVSRLRGAGHVVRLTSRDKDLTLPLLEEWGWEHRCLSRAPRGRLGLMGEWVLRNWRLHREVRDFQPDVILVKEGACGCQVGWWNGIPVLAIDDTDDARWQRWLSFPFASRLFTDERYPGRRRLRQRTYRCLSPVAYLRDLPRDPAVVEAAGLDPGRPFIAVRLVAWGASHDGGHRGFGRGEGARLLEALARRVPLVISSEAELPRSLRPFQYSLAPSRWHALLAEAAVYLGESATGATEAVVLGVPAIHLSTRRLWYTGELERAGLMENHRDGRRAIKAALRWLRPEQRKVWQQRVGRYLAAERPPWEPLERCLEALNRRGRVGKTAGISPISGYNGISGT